MLEYGFEEYTKELTKKDKIYVLLISIILKNKTKSNRITGNNIVKQSNSWIKMVNDKIFSNGSHTVKFGDEYFVINKKLSKVCHAKVGKVIQHLRSNAILPVIAVGGENNTTEGVRSVGYYISYDVDDILMQKASLNQRARGVMRGSDGMDDFIPENRKYELDTCGCGYKKIFECNLKCVNT